MKKLNYKDNNRRDRKVNRFYFKVGSDRGRKGLVRKLSHGNNV